MKHAPYSTRGMGLENVTLIGIISLALTILLLSFGDSIQHSILTGETHAILNTVALTANTVRDLGGEGSKETILIRVPGGLEGSTVNGNTITYDVGEETVDLQLGYPLLGNLPHTKGAYELSITSVTGGAIKIGNWPYLERITPSCVGQDQLPITITLEGHDFTTTSKVLLDNTLHPSTYLDGQHLEITAETTLTLGTHSILVQDTTGNALTPRTLLVHASSTSC